MRNVKKLSEQELKNLPKSSWHDEYRSSAWIFVGGLPYDLSEGDVLAIFSQYGEIANLNLVRDKDTGKQKGFCFICYEDQRSTVLSVDNFNGTRVLGRILRVDHVKDYKPPKSSEPTAKIKTEEIDDGFKIKSEYKTETKQQIFTPFVKREIRTPEIKREICTPEIVREVCTPEIVREVCTPEKISSPDPKSDKKKKKSKNKDEKKYSRDKSKDKDTDNKHQRERSKEKNRKKPYKREIDKSYEGEKRNKRPRRSKSRETDANKDSKIKSYKEHSIQDKSKEIYRKQLKDDRKEYKKKDYEEKYKYKHY